MNQRICIVSCGIIKSPHRRQKNPCNHAVIGVFAFALSHMKDAVGLSFAIAWGMGADCRAFACEAECCDADEMADRPRSGCMDAESYFYNFAPAI